MQVQGAKSLGLPFLPLHPDYHFPPFIWLVEFPGKALQDRGNIPCLPPMPLQNPLEDFPFKTEEAGLLPFRKLCIDICLECLEQPLHKAQESFLFLRAFPGYLLQFRYLQGCAPDGLVQPILLLGCRRFTFIEAKPFLDSGIKLLIIRRLLENPENL